MESQKQHGKTVAAPRKVSTGMWLNETILVHALVNSEKLMDHVTRYQLQKDFPGIKMFEFKEKTWYKVIYI